MIIQIVVLQRVGITVSVHGTSLIGRQRSRRRAPGRSHNATGDCGDLVVRRDSFFVHRKGVDTGDNPIDRAPLEDAANNAGSVVPLRHGILPDRDAGFQARRPKLFVTSEPSYGDACFGKLGLLG